MDGALIPQGPETSLRVCQLQQCCYLVSRSVHRALAPILKELATEEKDKRSLQVLLQELHASNKELRKIERWTPKVPAEEIRQQENKTSPRGGDARA